MTIEKLILIGSSTGGPGHIEKILRSLPATLTSRIIIAQHMDKNLLESFSNRLDSIAKVDVRILDDTTPIQTGAAVQICSQSCRIDAGENGLKITNVDLERPTYNPDIDTFFHSAAELTGQFKILCILLTGIGSDGAKGMLELKKKGALTIAESEESAIVYGMPRSAHEMGAACKILPLESIIEEIIRFDSEPA